MKITTAKKLLTTVAFLWVNLVAFAQKPERVDFAKAGSPALVWEQNVKANGSKDFVFAAKKGQKLTLSFIDDTNKGSMDLGKVSIEPNADEPFTMTIDVTKDYNFSVTNNSDKATSFRIFITLDNPKKPMKKATKAKKS